jgi:hypothetical protein
MSLELRIGTKLIEKFFFNTPMIRKLTIKYPQK